jgi:hypothetical protein
MSWLGLDRDSSSMISSTASSLRRQDKVHSNKACHLLRLRYDLITYITARKICASIGGPTVAAMAWLLSTSKVATATGIANAKLFTYSGEAPCARQFPPQIQAFLVVQPVTTKRWRSKRRIELQL